MSRLDASSAGIENWGASACEMLQRLWQVGKALPARALIGLVRIYQRGISPLLGPNCRFQPTCSEYMIGAVRKYGLLKGLWKGVVRILRCHPFARGGYDPP